MAFDVSALAAYIENSDFPIIAKVQTSSDTASLVSKQVGIKKSSNLHFMETDVVFQSGANCNRTASGTTTMTDKTITVGDVAIYENLCIKDLNGKYAQIYLQRGAAGDSVLPGEIEGVYLENKMEILKKQLEVSDWQGDTLSGTNNLSYYDGWLKLIDAGSPINGNTGSITAATGISVSNIIPAVQGMYLSIPQDIRGRQDLSLFLPREWYDLYVVALINANLFHYAVADGTVAKIHGTNVMIRPTDGLNTTNRMILTYNENLVLGLDGDADEDVIDVRLDPVTNKNVFVDIMFKRGCQVRFVEQVVEFTLVP